MKRRLASILLLLVDAVVIIAVPYIALLIRFDGNVSISYITLLNRCLPLLIIIRLAVFYCFGLYNRIWRYASIGELLSIVAAVTSSSVLIWLVNLILHYNFPRTFYVISLVLNIIFIGANRLCIRVLSHKKRIVVQDRDRVVIIGAGDAGAMVARELREHCYNEKLIAGFIDDDPAKRHHKIYGIKVLGNRSEIHKIVNLYQVNEIVIAIPSLSGSALKPIIQEAKQTGRTVKTVPGYHELINGKVKVSQLRQVDLEDLLRREPIKLDPTPVVKCLAGKRVLVTGAGGSIGAELCRQIASFSPRSLILLGKGENSIYEIHQELALQYPDLKLEPVIADVRDKQRINAVFSRYKPEAIFHAAAHKHVPLMELQPEEAVKNNVFGTKTVAEAARQCNAAVMIMISTDKAVNPTSVMGATKRIAEQVIQSMNQNSKTKFAAVRFGNVLGSRGSVVPLFKKQIAQGGPVTVTDPRMTRYFMTIPEAVQLVLQAGAMAEGGEVFVLDMGEPVRIYDMACALIELSGLKPHEDIEIRYTGLRPGEKLYEELLTAEEGTTATRYKLIHKANLQAVNNTNLQQGLFALHNATQTIEVLRIIKELVPTYSGINDRYDASQPKTELRDVENLIDVKAAGGGN
jgi:FlaA1/EpsC-like NDP-sugar epimerase